MYTRQAYVNARTNYWTFLDTDEYIILPHMSQRLDAARFTAEIYTRIILKGSYMAF